MTKKLKRSPLSTSSYQKAFENIADLTDKATASEREYALKIGQFLSNTFIHIFRHIIGMALDPSSAKIETLKGSRSKGVKQEKGAILVSYFVAFIYELIAPAVEMQDEDDTPMGMNVNGLARELGVIEEDEVLQIGQPERFGDGAVCVPCAIGKRENEDTSKSYKDINDMVLDVLQDKDLEAKFKEFLADNLDNIKRESGSA